EFSIRGGEGIFLLWHRFRKWHERVFDFGDELVLYLRKRHILAFRRVLCIGKAGGEHQKRESTPYKGNGLHFFHWHYAILVVRAAPSYGNAHCPTVNYTTAVKFPTRLRNFFGLPQVWQTWRAQNTGFCRNRLWRRHTPDTTYAYPTPDWHNCL